MAWYWHGTSFLKMLHFLQPLRLWIMGKILRVWRIKIYHRLIGTLISLSYNAAGSINISSILTGKCLAKINPGNGNSCKQKKAWKFQNTVSEALEDITALYFDEERDEIYTGNRHGLVHVWSNWKLKAFTCLMVLFSFTCMCINSQYLMWWGYEEEPPGT